ncbi:MAG: helix-turn-helix transcriptional regulator [Marinicellaceae bacterium]
MEIWLDLTAIVFAVGALQGVVFGIILFNSNQYNKRANRWLALLLWFLAYRLLVQTLRLFGLGYYDSWYYVMLDLSWVTGPLIYFYIRSQLFPTLKFKTIDWLHFLPLVIQVSFSFYVRLQNLYWDGTRESLSWLGYWGYVVWMNNPTIYLVTSAMIVIYAFKAQALLKQKNVIDNTSVKRMQWLNKFLSIFKLFFAVSFLILISDLLIHLLITDKSYFYFNRFYYYPFFAAISLLTYWLGMAGFMRKDQQESMKKKPISQDKKQQLLDIIKKLEELMKFDKVYKEPGLSLRDVAEILHVKEYMLSQALNEISSVKFIDYINTLRIAEVQNQLDKPENLNQSLLNIAFDAGFNSKSTFNRAVKKQLGISPQELKANK